MKNINHRLTKLEALCNEEIKGLINKFEHRVGELLSIEEVSAFWCAFNKAESDLTAKEMEVHCKVCLDEGAWNLFTELNRKLYALADTPAPDYPTHEEIQRLHDQNC